MKLHSTSNMPHEKANIENSPSKSISLLSDLAILFFFPQDFEQFALLTEAAGVNLAALCTHVYMGEHFSIIQSPMGAPMAALCLEDIIASGVRRVIVISRCGALHGTVKLGDWIFPKVCISDEGTSPHYLSASAASSLTIKGQFAQSLWQHIALCSVRCHKGSIVSTDSPLCLDHCRFISAGVLGVDMELAALVAVARMRKVSLASVLLVTDFARKGFPLFVTSGGISVELSRLRLLHSIIKLITETAQGQNESSCCPIE